MSTHITIGLCSEKLFRIESKLCYYRTRRCKDTLTASLYTNMWV